jgi:hypothetical protein
MLPAAFLVSVTTTGLFQIVRCLNIDDLRVSISDYPVITPDNYHPPLHVGFKITFD